MRIFFEIFSIKIGVRIIHGNKYFARFLRLSLGCGIHGKMVVPLLIFLQIYLVDIIDE